MSTSISQSEQSSEHISRYKYVLGEQDRKLILATQGGLPLVADPWGALSRELGMPADEVLSRFQSMQDAGVIRRVAAAPDHYRLGYRFNGMTVWDVRDDAIADMGRQVGELPFVSHCYRRPRHLPYWTFNLFAMVHGTGHGEVEDKASQIQALLGDTCRDQSILYSSAILKKTGLRLRKQ